MLLKSYRRFGKLEIPLEELRSILEINTDEYTLYKNFKARVLETARLEMEEKNDICFKYEDVRRSRKSPVEKIIFYIFDNPNAKEILEKARKMFEQDKTNEAATPPRPKKEPTLFETPETIVFEPLPDTVNFENLNTQKEPKKQKNTEGVGEEVLPILTKMETWICTFLTVI